MTLVKNLKFFHVFIVGQISQQNVFDDILERKNAFLDSKIRKLRANVGKHRESQISSKNSHFG